MNLIGRLMIQYKDLLLNPLAQFPFTYVIGVSLLLSFVLLVKRIVNRYLPYKIQFVYIFQLIFVIPLFVASVLVQDFSYVLPFFIVGFIGMAAEAFYDFYWHQFNNKPLWEYTLGAIFNKYTSSVNFVAWSTSAVVFIGIVYFFDSLMKQDQFIVFADYSLYFILTFTLIFAFLARIYKSKKADSITFVKYLIIVLPILLGFIFSCSLTSWIYLVYVFCFGIIAFVSEYLYGKILEYVFGKKFWIYNYATIDNDSTSPFNIIPAMFAGVLFAWVMLVL